MWSAGTAKFTIRQVLFDFILFYLFFLLLCLVVWPWLGDTFVLGTGRLGFKRTSGDNSNHSFFKIGQKTEKSPGDLRRLELTWHSILTNFWLLNPRMIPVFLYHHRFVCYRIPSRCIKNHKIPSLVYLGSFYGMVLNLNLMENIKAFLGCNICTNLFCSYKGYCDSKSNCVQLLKVEINANSFTWIIQFVNNLALCSNNSQPSYYIPSTHYQKKP